MLSWRGIWVAAVGHPLTTWLLSFGCQFFNLHEIVVQDRTSTTCSYDETLPRSSPDKHELKMKLPNYLSVFLWSLLAANHGNDFLEVQTHDADRTLYQGELVSPSYQPTTPSPYSAMAKWGGCPRRRHHPGCHSWLRLLLCSSLRVRWWYSWDGRRADTGQAARPQSEFGSTESEEETGSLRGKIQLVSCPRTTPSNLPVELQVATIPHNLRSAKCLE